MSQVIQWFVLFDLAEAAGVLMMVAAALGKYVGRS